ncbi:hypothetical protein Tco_0624735 [Tanacetum coccineum]|uniref:Uncharacterized protein n=1 Tax=Tanacetum coccineum TaxID=301880 RepID=A0ABQ4WEU5_9ASTR
MTKVIKGEFETLEDLKVKDVSLTFDTSFEVFNNKFNRIRGDDEVELMDEEFSDIEDEVAKDIEGFKTYEEYKDDLIYEWNRDVPWVDEKPWSDTRVWTESTPIRWESHEITYNDHDKNENHDERQELCEAHKLPVCNMRRFKMIKYSFGQDKEYVAIKKDEYDDLAKISDDACRAYQKIFRRMDGNLS